MMEQGPIYGANLFDRLPIGQSQMLQELPSVAELEALSKQSETAFKAVCAYEVLSDHLRRTASLLSGLHEWFLEKSPENYKGCGLCIDVSAQVERIKPTRVSKMDDSVKISLEAYKALHEVLLQFCQRADAGQESRDALLAFTREIVKNNPHVTDDFERNG